MLWNRERLTSTTDLVDVLQEIGWILIDAVSACALELVFPVPA